MTEMIRQQLLTYGISIMCGYAVGIVLGIVKCIRVVFGKKNVMIAIGDILYYIMLSCIVIIVNYIYSEGEIRLYVFLGIFSGILLYFGTIHWILAKIYNYILCLLKNALNNVILATKKLVDIICRKG